jgi:RNA polymerase sigma factor (TIGR02999 family)
LIPLVYEELRRLARQRLQHERGDHTLQPTALVHEAYLRLAGQHRAHWQNRTQFLAVAAQLMRHILVDHARAHATDKRGGEAEHFLIEQADPPAAERAVDLLAVDDVLEQLARIDERKSRVVELRFFGGLTIDETAEAMGLTSATVRREWTFAKAWLQRALSASRAPASKNHETRLGEG